jgi:hypothetical protein
MLKMNNYIVNENKLPSASGAVVLVKSIEEKEVSKNPSAAILASIVCSIVLVSQVAFISQQVLAEDAPITSPISSPEQTASPSPSVAPSEAPSNNNNSGNNNSGNSGGGSSNNSGGGSSSPSAPSCNDQKPGSAPKLISAISSGPNSAILTWSGAKDPVTNYAVVYGLKANTPLYGNANIGGKFTNSFEVKGLSGNTTYFFKVRAGNGCMPGDFSNEVSVKVSGNKIKYPAQGFKEGVLGSNTKKITPQFNNQPLPSTKAEVSYEVIQPNTPKGNPVTNFFSKIFGLFNH